MTNPVQLKADDVENFASKVRGAMSPVPNPSTMQHAAAAYAPVTAYPQLPSGLALQNTDGPANLKNALVAFTDALERFHTGATNSGQFYAQFATLVSTVFPDIDKTSAADFNKLVIPKVSKQIPKPGPRAGLGGV